MFLAGDEFGNSQHGNNNAYCQDNMISWLDWSLPEKNKELFEFFSYMIHFRKEHTIVRKNTSACSIGFPCVSLHEATAWNDNYRWDSHVIGIMYAGKEDETDTDDIIFLSINTYWESVTQQLPQLPPSMHWEVIVDTYMTHSILSEPRQLMDNHTFLQPRSVQVLMAVQR